jgi:hypothetical protein
VALELASGDLELGSNAAAVTEDFTSRLAAQHKLVREVCGLDPVSQMLGGVSPIAVPAHLPSRAHREMLGYIRNAALYQLWIKSKIVYSVHPEMLAELADCGSTRLPGQIFDLLPHTNPFVVFPSPIPTTAPDGMTACVTGFLVYGRSNKSRNICSTHDDERSALGLLFFTNLYDGAGRHIDTEIVSADIPVVLDSFTVEQAVDTTLATFTASPGDAGRTESLRGWLGGLLRLALNTLLYLCTDEPDFTTVVDRRSPKAKKKDRAARGRSPTMIRVGWRLGPALGRLRRAAANKYSSATGTGTGQPTHQRRCHFRTFWVGPGRVDAILKFIKPYWVRLDRVDGIDYCLVPVRSRAASPRRVPTSRSSR